MRKAVERALAFLADHQNAHGSFGARAYQGNVGITGLAALAFVAAGAVFGRRAMDTGRILVCRQGATRKPSRW